MSTTIDERVVEMRFDNKDFEKNVRGTMSTLDKFKQKLNLTGASKGLENVNAAASKVNMSGLSGAIEAVHAKFSALEVMGITALANITNSAVNAGKRIASALTIEPIKTGFQEYETQINAIQTILANTESKGSTLKDVNASLDELNTYADKTIYNFTEMTKNIGTFTAAGVDLKTSTSAIQGIANLAAVSGSNAQQASTAMYQLSQALASGTVKLMDWNSVVNAGMGGQVFQDALKQTARKHGVAIDKMIKKEGSFRETLKDGWLTSEILTETLSKMTQSGAAEYLSKLTGVSQEQIKAAQKAVETNKDGTASYEEIAAQMAKTGKISKKEALEILKMADTATNAATKVKTFTQLWDTTKEAVQSGWTQSWEIMVGDFEEAKNLLTNISDVLGKMISKSAESRNKVLQEWKDLGGRDDILAAFKNVFEGISSIVNPVREAFKDIFPSITGSQLANFSENLKELTSKLILGDEQSKKLKETFKGLFSILDIGRKAIMAVVKPLAEFLTGSSIASLGDGILTVTASIGNFFTKLNEGTKIGEGFSLVGDIIVGALNLISDAASSVLKGFSGFGNFLSDIWGVVTIIGGKIKSIFGDIINWIRENISAGDIFAGLAGGGIFIAFKKISGVFDNVSEFVDKIKDLFSFGKEGAGAFSELLGNLNDSLSAFTQGIKVASLVGIAVAITLLSSSLRKIAELEVGDIAISLVAMRIMIAELNTAFAGLCKTLIAYPAKGTFKAALSLIAISGAVSILASAMKKISELSWEDLAKGLLSVKLCISALTKGVQKISQGGVTLRTSIAILALAKACGMLGDALKKFGSLSWEEIGKGLLAMGGALTEFTLALKVMDKFSGGGALSGSIAMLIASKSLDEISENLEKLGSLAWDVIGRGLAAMGGALFEFGIVLATMGKIAGFSNVSASVALLIASKSLDEISENLDKFGEMAWDEIGRGLSAMGGALGELVLSLSILGKVAGFSGIFAAGSLVIVTKGLDEIVNALQNFGFMSWGEIGRGLAAMGGALGELTIAIGVLGKLAGFSGIFAAGSLLIVIQGLDKIADAMNKFGLMPWGNIGRGLTAMGGALGELALTVGVLGTLAGFSGIFGSGSILLVVKGLDPIAEALQKFGSMSWGEIGRGLTAMGGALTELGVAVGAIGYLTGFAGLVGAGTITLASQGLGEIADALIKFGSMSWDEIGRGLSAMGGALGEIGLGGILNTFSALGSVSIAVIAKPLGDLADSFKKWGEIKYEDIADGLKAMDIAFAEIAAGGIVNTLSGLGSLSIAVVAKPLGDLADSVKKWTDVVVPEGLASQLAALASAVFSFTFSGMGADAIATAAPGIGQMADSIKKWSDVTVPEGIQNGLTNIAEGVKAFSFAFAGGWSMGAITGPLGNLADSIKKWADVIVPENIKDGLKNIAEGVKAFSFAFAGGWSIGAIVTPLADLSETVKKWADVTIPDSIKDGLKNIAEGIEEFTILGAVKLSSIAEPIGTLSEAFAKFSGIEGNGGSLKTFAQNLVDCTNKLSELNSTSVTDASTTINELTDIMKKVNGTNISNVGNFVLAANSLNDIDIKEISVDTAALQTSITAIRNTMNMIRTTIFNSRMSINNAMKVAVSGIVPAIKDIKNPVDNTIKAILNGMNSAIKGFKGKVEGSFKSITSAGASAVKTQYSSYVSAGKYLGEGLVSGINAMQQSVYNAAYALGQAAVRGEKDGQQSNSPSKATIKAGKWLGEGLVIGIKNMNKNVVNAGSTMGESAINSISYALNNASNILNSDLDSNPTIRPVLDLTEVESGAGYLNTMFNNGPSIGVMSNLSAISSGMDIRLQNGQNSEVVSAIDKLRKDLGNIGGDTYNIDGISVGESNEITQAVKDLIRAIKQERRT